MVIKKIARGGFFFSVVRLFTLLKQMFLDINGLNFELELGDTISIILRIQNQAIELSTGS